MTGAYLKCNGEWSSDVQFAQDFESINAAVVACVARQLRDVELVLIMGKGLSREYDVVLPVNSTSYSPRPDASDRAGA